MNRHRINKDRSSPVVITTAPEALFKQRSKLARQMVSELRGKMKDHAGSILRREEFDDCEVPVLTTFGGDLIAAELTAAMLSLEAETASVEVAS